jgi:glycosyltransferase involved in cell wall biosynthesis
LKVALVHDWLNQMGGAERVLLTLGAMFPEAPIFTSIYGPDLVDARFREKNIHTSIMQKLPGVKTRHRWYLPLFPTAFDRMRIEGFDVVISNASAFCKGVRTPASSLHVCYCLTPTRFVWNAGEYLAREDMRPTLRLAVLPLLIALRRWDRNMAKRVDRFVAISQAVAARIKSRYRRNSEIIYPPVNVDSFAPGPRVGDYFLVVSRLAPYKRVDLAVAACTKLNVPLKVVGSGRDLQTLTSIAGPTVEFLGQVDDEQVRHYLARCKALIFPGEEDFGIVPVEAQASGRPVVAYGAGGALETVIPGRTGEFFHEPTVESLMEVLKRFDDSRYSPTEMNANAKQFGESVFADKFARFVRTARAEHKKSQYGGGVITTRPEGR